MCSMPIYTSITELHYQQPEKFSNSSKHNINARNKHNLHSQNTNLSFFQKSTFCVDIKIFNILPHSLTALKNEKAIYKVVLSKYSNPHSFYSVNEFFMCNDDI
jgi:5-bromo-4-chloroindolyl phosphate hydrolysis protein